MYNPTTLEKFIYLLLSINPNTYFDVEKLKEQATEEDLQFYNEHGYWFWGDETKKAYEEDIKRNKFLQEYPKGQYMKNAQKIYNENIIKKILSWKSIEGQFLINGVITGNYEYEENKNLSTGHGKFPYTSGQLPKGDSHIVCKDNQLHIKQNRLNNDSKYLPLDHKLLPTIVPNFKFYKESCDPCVALKYPPDYSCPFSINGEEPSYIWKLLWNL
jgi:hypothetical protein